MAQYIFLPASISESRFLLYKFLRSGTIFPLYVYTSHDSLQHNIHMNTSTQTFDTDKTNWVLHTNLCNNIPEANLHLYRVPVSETQVTGKEGAWKTDRSAMSSSSSSSSTLPLNSVPPSLPPCSWKSSASLSSIEPELVSESWGIKHITAFRQTAESEWMSEDDRYSPLLELSDELTGNSSFVFCRKQQSHLMNVKWKAEEMQNLTLHIETKYFLDTCSLSSLHRWTPKMLLLKKNEKESDTDVYEGSAVFNVYLTHAVIKVDTKICGLVLFFVLEAHSWYKLLLES